MLKALHEYRSISLQLRIDLPNQIQKIPNNYIAQSARFVGLFKILEADIVQRKERVIIFLESLELQSFLAQIIKERYRLKKLLPLLSGEVPFNWKRQKYVD